MTQPFTNFFQSLATLAMNRLAALSFDTYNEALNLKTMVEKYRDECKRVEVERRFSLAKRKCGIGLMMMKLKETVSSRSPCLSSC
jgi:hypothetical protein